MTDDHKSSDQTVQHPKRNFYIFGYNISHSLSPKLHNAGFKELGLPHHYSIHQSESVDKSVEEIIGRPDFGGASVTFPHKLQIGRLLQLISPEAEKIGSVNTVVVKDSTEGRILIGDNTDWSGIKACIESCEYRGLETSTALVVGAGGAARAACHAIETLGIRKVNIVNRTKATASAMAKNFPALSFQFFESFEQLCEAGRPQSRLIIACIPADDLVEDKIPTSLFEGVQSGILVEMAYRPLETGMMKVAGRYEGWRVVRGTDVLQEQAFAQFRLWTGEAAPVAVMREAVRVS